MTCGQRCEPPWVDQELGSLRKAKLKANRCTKRSEKVSDWTAYRKLKNLVQSAWHKKHKSGHLAGLSVKTNPPKIWSNVKSKTGSGGMPQDMCLKGEKLSTAESQADSFRKYFQSIFSNYDKPSDSLESEPYCEKKQFRPRNTYSNWKRSRPYFAAIRSKKLLALITFLQLFWNVFLVMLHHPFVVLLKDLWMKVSFQQIGIGRTSAQYIKGREVKLMCVTTDLYHCSLL